MNKKAIKHIRIPKRIWDAWEAGMLSGEYPKDIGALRTVNGYCCLGVLQMVVSGKVECWADGGSKGTPTFEWLKDNGITFFNKHGDVEVVPYIAHMEQGIASLNDSVTCYATDDSCTQKYTFKDIAEFLKTEVEFTDET